MGSWLAEPLQTERLWLRPTRPGDEEWIIQLFTDPEVRKYLGGAMSEAEARVSVKLADELWGHFAIVDRQSDEVVGSLSFARRRDTWEISYELRRASWGQGIAAEAIRVALRWFFSVTDGEEVSAVTQAANKRSCRLLERLGAQPTEESTYWGVLVLRYVFDRPLSRPDKTGYPTPYPDVNAVLDALLSAVQRVLGARFVGMYLGGSLATGEFDPLRSDIDFLVVTTDDLPRDAVNELQTVHDHIAAGESKWVKELEGCYIPQRAVRRYVPTEGPYPIIERYERLTFRRSDSHQVIERHILREHGITLAGPDIRTLIEPISPREIRKAILRILAEWWVPILHDPELLVDSPGYRAYAVLTMCRMLHTLENSTIVSKQAAASWAQEMLGEPKAAVIKRALVWKADEPAVILGEALDMIQYTVEQCK